jgi:hypothetical protein
MDDFYKIMGEFYSSDMKKHASPTKRLIQQKEAAVIHKQFLANKMKATQDYQLTYVASPKKTYVIEPKGGEINYALAHKDPLKFYDNVMSQDIREHSVASKGTKVRYSNVLTKRAIAKVLEMFETKLASLIKEQTAAQFAPEHLDEAELHEALQHHEMEHAYKKQLTEGQIKMVNKRSGSPAYVGATRLIGERGKQAADDSLEGEDIDLDAEPVEAELVSYRIVNVHSMCRSLRSNTLQT